ncbi:xylose isomerase [Agrobacterium larrymoorei]|uniref:Sugar phosphate isomerase/epimerase n=1 Tax=Agrobacterium larrymoorei TaxID=160699 RepID=A0A4D7DXS7_9HYPH|nr:xylose isomerase [Agrobacterium larrymoorei]QCJ01079.1 sugar phosphate isomerase/epimerase [Agrobacterium larrymoorei]QYA10096.1 sugar phosphate isomerase/epimerase [Agrobacterium larrymoorei]
MQNFLVLQSLWAMERRHTDGYELLLEENIAKIAGAGFGGVSAHCHDRDSVRRIKKLLPDGCKYYEGQCFVQTIDDLKPVLEVASEFGVDHLDVHADIRPRKISDCVSVIEGWQRLAEQITFPVLLETHRDRVTSDLLFTLDLLDQFPNLQLLGDLSHYMVGREFAWPISNEIHVQIERIMDHCWAYHGRVSSPQQIQVEISFPQHQQWVDVFLGWWRNGFQSWRKRAGADATLPFVCELGPKPYAITGPDGNDISDRWNDALVMKKLVQGLWASLSDEFISNHPSSSAVADI